MEAKRLLEFRGRQWAAMAPRSIVLKRNGKITNEALNWFLRGDII